MLETNVKAEKQELTLASFKRALQESYRKGKPIPYIKGPIPHDWISRCSKLGAKCLNVGMALWWVQGMTNNPTVALTSQVRREWAVGRSSASYALKLMEKAELVEVERHPGRAPRVTILWDGSDGEAR
jgi:hypothetical protein